MRAKHASLAAALATLVLGLNVARAETPPQGPGCNGSGNSVTVTGLGNGNGNDGTSNGMGNGQGNLELVGVGDNCSQNAGGTRTTKQTGGMSVTVSCRRRQVVAIVRLVSRVQGTVAVQVSRRGTLRVAVHHGGNRYTATVPASGTWTVTTTFTGRQRGAERRTVREVRTARCARAA